MTFWFHKFSVNYHILSLKMNEIFYLIQKRWSQEFQFFHVFKYIFEFSVYSILIYCRYYGKSTALLCDVTKIISMIKGKCGEHRTFRLAENLCINLILSIRDFFVVKKDLKVTQNKYQFFKTTAKLNICKYSFLIINALQGSSDFTETLNRITIVSLAITIKTRGIADVDHMLRLQPVLEQIMSTCQHTWSDKTMRHFPQLIRDFLIGRMDRRAHTIQTWEQVKYLYWLSLYL